MHQDLLVADILKLLISSTVTLTVLLAASIFQTIIVIVVFKILEKYLFKKFSFRNEFLETLCQYTSPEGKTLHSWTSPLLKAGGCRTFRKLSHQGGEGTKFFATKREKPGKGGLVEKWGGELPLFYYFTVQSHLMCVGGK